MKPIYYLGEISEDMLLIVREDKNGKSFFNTYFGYDNEVNDFNIDKSWRKTTANLNKYRELEEQEVALMISCI